MSVSVSNVEIITDKWESVVLKLNRALYALSNEIVTANATYANTGNSTISKTTQLYGTFGSNTVVVSNELRGGNVNGLSANLTISSNVVVSNGLIRVGNSTVNNTINSVSFYTANSTANLAIGMASIVPSGNLVIGSNNTVSVNGALTITRTVEIAGNNVSIANTFATDISVNTDIGSNTTSPVLLYRFPKANYSSGELLIQVTNTGNTQISKMVLAHDNTTAQITVFGTVASPSSGNSSSSPLGTYTANVNNANVEILINQTVANSAVKIIANLIK